VSDLLVPPELDRQREPLPDQLLARPQFLQAVARQGDVVRYMSGAQRRVLVSDPALIQRCLGGDVPGLGPSPVTRAARVVLGDGLLTIEELERWRPRRVLIQREISHRNVRRHAAQFAELAQQRVAGWGDGGTIDLQAEMAQLSLDSLGAAIFTSDFGAFCALITAAMQALLDHSTAVDTNQDAAPTQAALRRSIADLDAFVQELVQARRIAPVARGDLLQTLVAAADAGGALFDDRWVRDELVTLLVAGHDTTALTATMALFLLARHPAVAGALRDELRAALARGVPPAELADEVPLARHVVEETLRLYPPLPSLTRTAQAPLRLGDYRIDAGDVLVFSAWVTQRDPRFFPEPERFDPWRFAGERRRQSIGDAYFPFGAGPRICVGNHFALLEVAIIVALATLQVTLQLHSADEPAMAPMNVLRCRDGLPATVRGQPQQTIGGAFTPQAR
jgi:cytochrome P450